MGPFGMLLLLRVDSSVVHQHLDPSPTQRIEELACKGRRQDVSTEGRDVNVWVGGLEAALKGLDFRGVVIVEEEIAALFGELMDYVLTHGSAGTCDEGQIAEVGGLGVVYGHFDCFLGGDCLDVCG